MDIVPGIPSTDACVQIGSAAEAACTIACECGCSERLRQAGLRATRQRMILGDLLFANGDRHVTAEMLFSEAREVGVEISLATVYNTLNQFTEAGLLRRIGFDGLRSFFDTNTSVHPHFYLDDQDILIDIPEPGTVLQSMPQLQLLPGHELSRIDVVIHLRRKQG